MNAGKLKLQMTTPVPSAEFSLRCAGSLAAMDLTCLNAFLGNAEHTRIKSGSVQKALFEIDVTDGEARGRVRAVYRDLEIAVLEDQRGSQKGLVNPVTSPLAQVLKIRNSNTPDASGSMKEGKVNHRRRPNDGFLKFAWSALRSGVVDLVSD